MVTSPLAAEHRANRIAVVLPSLEGGGAERSMLNLTKGLLAQGRKVDLVLCQAKGAYLDEIPDGANMVELEPSGAVQALSHAYAMSTFTIVFIRNTCAKNWIGERLMSWFGDVNRCDLSLLWQSSCPSFSESKMR